MNDDCATYNESNFDRLPSQSNIYGVTCIEGLHNTHNTILVALTKGKIYSCKYFKTSNFPDIQGISKEVSFTYIPGKCCIISIDSFACAARGLIIGVTFRNESNEHFLNIYCNYGDDLCFGQEWILDNVAQNCRSYDLSFTPYQLTHCKVECPYDKLQRTVFILAGGDKSFHVYAQRKNEAVFSEVNAEEYFTELGKVPEIPTYLEICNVNENRRITVIGCENGAIQAFLVNSHANTIEASWTIEHDSPISQIQLMLIPSNADNGVVNCFTNWEGKVVDVHVCVVSSCESTMLYRNLPQQGFNNPTVFANSSSYDVVTSCALAKNHIFGRYEILIGTYGQKLLAYNMDNLPNEAYSSVSPCWSRGLAHPILKVKLLDMTGDGIKEMMVLTTSGVHVFQFNIGSVLNKIKSKLNMKSS